MTEDEYDVLQTAAESAFKAVYLIDAASLTKTQRVTHFESLKATYLAVIRLERKQLSQLSEQAKTDLSELSTATVELQKSLAGFKQASEVLSIVSAAIGLLKAIAKLLI
jgi:hypothetical protein